MFKGDFLKYSDFPLFFFIANWLKLEIKNIHFPYFIRRMGSGISIIILSRKFYKTTGILTASKLYVAPSGVCATLSTNQKTGWKEYSKHRQPVNPFECFLVFTIIVTSQIQVFFLMRPCTNVKHIKNIFKKLFKLRHVHSVFSLAVMISK